MIKWIICFCLGATLSRAGIYYMGDTNGNVTRHRGDTPYPAGAVWNVAINPDIDTSRLEYVEGQVIMRQQSEVDAQQGVDDRVALLAQGSINYPILDAHPEDGEVLTGGMFYRLTNEDIIELWFARDNDHIASQLSAHDKDGNSIIRTFNLKTRKEDTIDMNKIVSAKNWKDLEKSKTDKVKVDKLGEK